MYEKYYSLTTRPFTMLPDPYFLYSGRNHSLAYGILNQAGFTVVTGEIGCGKTALLHQLLHSIDDRGSV